MKTAILMLLSTFGFIAGCHSPTKPAPSPYRSGPDTPNRDTDAARVANDQGLVDLGEGELGAAEASFKVALESDVTFAPAHNNLGKVYYQQKKLYQAAWEFQYASKLQPHQPEPKNNLGLVLESAGKLDDAVTNYDAAISIESDNPEYLSNAARARSRRGDVDDRYKSLLEQIAFKDSRPRWSDWARAKLARLSIRTREEDGGDGH